MDKNKGVEMTQERIEELNLLTIPPPSEIPESEMNSKEMVKKFKTLFADEIAYLSQWFEVKICFGLVSYYS